MFPNPDPAAVVLHQMNDLDKFSPKVLAGAAAACVALTAVFGSLIITDVNSDRSQVAKHEVVVACNLYFNGTLKTTSLNMDALPSVKHEVAAGGLRMQKACEALQHLQSKPNTDLTSSPM